MNTNARKSSLKLAVGLVFAAAAGAQPLPHALFDGLRWRMIGPFRGGRVIAVAGVAGDANAFYFGAVGGGVWKTTDAGTVWSPVFDSQPVASIGAIEVAPSDPNTIYVGTGETDLRSDISTGDGMYKSTDGGRTWRNIGLRDSRHIGRILIDPKDANRVWVAALGHAYGPNTERGVYRSIDGGQSWEKVLDKGPDVGAVDLAMVPENPQVIYASMWRARRPPWSQYPPLGGPGSGLYKSSDGGTTWIQLTGHGLPEGEWGRAGVAVARGTEGRCVYALIDTGGGGLFRSDDAGDTWTRVGTEPRIISRGWYFGRVMVDPRNPDTVYLPNVALYRSSDGGRTFSIVRGAPGGDDYHFLWIDPNAPARMILGTDQGATISVDGGRTWTTWYNQPTAQMYHVITDGQFPYHVYGAQQDSGTVAIPSRTDHGHIGEQDRFSVGGGESGYIAPDPRDPNIVYVGGTYGSLTRFDRRTSQGQNITPWPAPAFGVEIAQRKFRFPWTAPLVFSPLEPGTLFYGSQYLLETTDGGLAWTEISPDLTAPERTRNSGVIYSIAPSPLNAGLIWVGTDTGLVHLTRNGGKTWTAVTPKELTDWSKVTHIEASHFDPAVAYAAVDRHRLDDYKPYLFRTRDYGKSWTLVNDGMTAPAFLNAIREDPVRKGLLFAATESGVGVSFDDGDHWQSLRLNLPACSVRDLVVHGDDVVIATHGRGFWVLDDIAALRQADRKVAAAPVFLYRPAMAVRLSSEAFQGTPLPPEIPRAPNPPDGAIVDYYLAGAGEATLEILDSNNQVVRRFASNEPPPQRPHPPAIADIWITPPARLGASAGMNRFVWDLRYPPPPPLPGGRQGGGGGGALRGPQVLPGNYQVRLTVAGQSYTEPLKVVLDPRSPATTEDLKLQLDLALKTCRELARAKDPAVYGDLAAVLNVVESADRKPPNQAYVLFDQATRRLKAGLVDELKKEERALGVPASGNFAEHSPERAASYRCYFTGKLELPASYDGLQLRQGDDRGCPVDERRYDVFYYPIEAVASGHSPVTSALEEADVERVLMVVPHEDLHGAEQLKKLPTAVAEAATTLMGFHTAAEFARTSFSGDSETYRNLAREADLFLQKSKLVNRYWKDLHSVYAAVRAGRVSAGDAVRFKQQAFARLQAECLAIQPKPTSFNACPAANNNAGLAFDATYTRYYPQLYDLYVSVHRDLRALLQKLDKLGAEKYFRQ